MRGRTSFGEALHTARVLEHSMMFGRMTSVVPGTLVKGASRTCTSGRRGARESGLGWLAWIGNGRGGEGASNFLCRRGVES